MKSVSSRKGVGSRRDGLGLSLCGDSKLLPTPSRISACLLLGNHFRSGAGYFFFLYPSTVQFLYQFS